MVEPTACAVHAALARRRRSGDDGGRLGAGTLGLALIAALAPPAPPATDHRLVGAKHPHQRRWPTRWAPTRWSRPDELARAVRRQTGSLVARRGRLTGGADVVFDCVGTAESLAQALAMVRPRGRVVLVGHAGQGHRRPGRRCGTGRSRWSAPTPTGPSVRRLTAAPGAPSPWPWSGRRRRARPARVGHLPAGAASRRRWPTPEPPAPGAVKVAFDLRQDRTRKGRTP